MIHLDYIEMEALRSFVKPTRITFAKNGLWLIKSINKDTGGSSGGGKSSIGLAIRYALGDCPIPSTELKSWGSKIPATVKLALDAATISRGKKVEVTVGGAEKNGSIPQKEAEFIKVFGGLDLEMIGALSYRGQRQPGLFLNKGDSDKKAFLTKVLGLDIIESQVKESAKKITALEQELLGAGLKATNHEQRLEALEPDADTNEVEALGQQLRARMDERSARITALTNEHNVLRGSTEAEAEEVEKAYVKPMKEALAAVEATKAAAEDSTPDDPTVLESIAKLRATAEQCAARGRKLTEEDNGRRAELDAKKADLNRQIQIHNLVAGGTRGLQTDRDGIARQLGQMHVDICPTCERDWDKAAAHREQLSSRLQEIDSELSECNQARQRVECLRLEIAALPPFDPNPMIARLQEAGAKAKEQIASEEQKLRGAQQLRAAERRRAVAEANAAVSRLIGESGAAAAEVWARSNARLQELQIEAEQARREQKKDQEGLDQLSTQLARMQLQAEQSTKLRDELAVLNANYAAIEASLKAERDFAHLIGREGFLGSIFDEVLQEISDETNDILGSVANTRHITLQFRSENVTQKGTIEKEIRPIVTVRGHETTLRGGLSGGMLSTVELAVDLAVGAVVARRAGICPGWLILDESFDGLDTVSKETCIEILKIYAQERLVLVVDHASEMQGMFEHVIEVIYEDGISRMA
jgi:DNA repair exonuclease SbcCD ATPase subunit